MFLFLSPQKSCVRFIIQHYLRCKTISQPSHITLLPLHPQLVSHHTMVFICV